MFRKGRIPATIMFKNDRENKWLARGIYCLIMPRPVKLMNKGRKMFIECARFYMIK
jgi:hypothetical protein